MTDGSRLLADCDWQSDPRGASTIILVHGLEGSSRRSLYMVWTASKLFRNGFNVVRLNLRNCCDTEMWTPTLYHAGQSEDLREVVGELLRRDGLTSIGLVGFSMGGNLVLKLAGEWAGEAPAEVIGIATVSPLADLTVSWEMLNRRENSLYRRLLVRSIRRRLRRKAQFFPERYDLSDLPRVRSVHDFDELFQTRHSGFASAHDYYVRVSAAPHLPRVRIPALIIHAADDPILPVEPFRRAEISANPMIIRLLPEHGGHLGFFARLREDGLDQFWAENRVLEFFKLIRDSAGRQAEEPRTV